MGGMAQFTEASKTLPLVPGQKLRDSDYVRAQRPYTIQRLTERVYWIEAFIYQSTVFVGKEGVMVIDPLSYGRGEKVHMAIREVTDLPVITVVYSHYHIDHIADAAYFVAQAAQSGIGLRIVSTAACLNQIHYYGDKVPIPNEIIEVPEGHFMFEDERVMVGTPKEGHSIDNSWILLEGEGVVHNVDMIHPGQLEFDNFGVGHYISGYEDGLRALLRLDWNFMTAGHGNIGSREDVQFVLDYIADLRSITKEVLPTVDIVPFIRDEMMYNWFHGHRDEVASQVVERMRPRWGRYSGFDLVAMSHAKTMYWEYYLH